MGLNSEKNERLKLCTTICQLEDQQAQLRRQVNEPFSSSLSLPFTVNPPSSAAFEDSNALGSIQTSRPRVTIKLKRTSSTTSRSQLTEPPRAPSSTQTPSGPSSDLQPTSDNWKKKLTRQGIVAKQLHPSTDFNLPFSMIEFGPRSLEAQTLSCGN